MVRRASNTATNSTGVMVEPAARVGSHAVTILLIALKRSTRPYAGVVRSATGSALHALHPSFALSAIVDVGCAKMKRVFCEMASHRMALLVIGLGVRD